MDLPKSKTEFLLQGSKFVLRLPFLYLSFLAGHPINISPLSIEMNITDRCNFRCKMCRGMNENYIPKDEIDFDSMKTIIDEMRKLKIPYLTLGGGEPFLRYDFILKTIDYAKKLGIRVGIVTNGSLVDEERLSELSEAGMDRIAFSLDAANRDVHDWIRMPGSFDHIISLLEMCQRLKAENKSKFRVYVYTVVMKQNFRELLEIAYIARRFEALAFYQPVCVPQVYPVAEDNCDPSTQVEPFVIGVDDLADLELEIGKLIDFKKKYGVVGNLIWQLRNIVNYYKSLETGNFLARAKCYAGFNNIHLESNGDFGSCLFMPYVGNTQNGRLREAWVSTAWDEQRKRIKHCSRPCALNCYYPVLLTALAYEFVFLPIKRRLSLK
jgi:MoaA/NifB/PqqE/SkfB family radical SAM enzyme